TSTVHAPQFVVSQPIWVPDRPSPWRSRCASSSLGSTSTTLRAPLTVTVILRAFGPGSTTSTLMCPSVLLISGCHLRSVLPARLQCAHDERVDDASLVVRATTQIARRSSRLGRQPRRFADRFGVQGLP